MSVDKRKRDNNISPVQRKETIYRKNKRIVCPNPAFDGILFLEAKQQSALSFPDGAEDKRHVCREE